MIQGTSGGRALEPGASVSAIAHRIGIHPSELFAWRRDAPMLGPNEPTTRGLRAAKPRWRACQGSRFPLARWSCAPASMSTRRALAAGDQGDAFGMIPSGVKVFLASHPVDFRKGIDGPACARCRLRSVRWGALCVP
ncbi:transposase [Bradyrhizobium sp. ERR14]|uniref:transposase n=1 Tax=Bradyrhizobium sp. ERR14 TaxID=2663837 RepID=UPI00160D88E8